MALITIEVVYALPQQQWTCELRCVQPVSILQAIEQSGVGRLYPAIRVEPGLVGVFGRKRPLDWQLEHGDRVEIYRPLHLSPVEARRLRAAKSGRNGAGKRAR